MKRYAQLIISLCLLAAVIPAAAAAEQKVVKVGVILPLTGSLAKLGTNIRDGFILWGERQQQSAYSFKFLFEDDQFLPKSTSAAAHRLISVEKVDVLITFTSTPGNVVVPLAERHKIPHICFTVDRRLAKGLYNFVHLYQPPQMVERLLEKLRKEKLYRIGVFRFIEEAAEASFKEMVKQTQKSEFEIVYDNLFPAGTTDFRSMISRAKQKDAQVAVLLVLPPELEILTRQIREQNYEATLTTLDLFSLSNEPQLFDGLWYVTPAYPPAECNKSAAKRIVEQSFPDHTVITYAAPPKPALFAESRPRFPNRPRLPNGDDPEFRW